ncbi:MAG: 23S rRNA (guanosine(2251)-2'-O)-methyltransferase RlmB [Rhodothermales bacterium]|nr:23S rRNA (guanosine(2251)-2'-O)-methyltransferase RlmB [Rhodothermales bacterium]
MSKGPQDTRAEYIAGRNPVRELLEGDAGRIQKLNIQKSSGGSMGELHALARDAGIPVRFVPTAALEKMVPGVNHQGVVASVSPIRYLDADEMLSAIAPTRDEVRESKPIVLILDHIQDPHNLGAIVRSAVAAGVNGMIIPERGAAPVTAASVKTSAGTISHLPIARVGNVSQTIYRLKERGYWIAGADGAGELTPREMDWDRPIGLVIGSEESGMGRAVRDQCDHVVRIPMRGPAESLNASVAAGILLFEAVQCRM